MLSLEGFRPAELWVAIRRHLWLIIILFAVSLGAGLLFNMSQPVFYEASAYLIVNQPPFQISLEPRFLSPLPNVQQTRTTQNVLALVRIPTLERQVVEANGSILSPSEREPGELLKRMRASPLLNSDVLTIRVRGREPEVAVKIANSWSYFFVKMINAISNPTPLALPALEKELDNAKQNLTEVEKEIAQYQLENRTAMLEKELDARVKVLGRYTELREGIEADVLSSEIGAKTALMGKYRQAANNLRLISEDARGLRDKLARDGAAPSLAGQLSALLLEVNALNSDPRTPIQLQLPLDGIASGSPGGDQARLLASLMDIAKEKEKAATEEANRIGAELVSFQRLDFATSSRTGSPLASRIDSTFSEMQRLQKEIAEETAKLERVNLKRTLAKTTVTTLSNKLEESKIAGSVNAGMAQVISPAIVPTEAEGPRVLDNTLVAAGLGLFFGVLGALALERLGK